MNMKYKQIDDYIIKYSSDIDEFIKENVLDPDFWTPEKITIDEFYDLEGYIPDTSFTSDEESITITKQLPGEVDFSNIEITIDGEPCVPSSDYEKEEDQLSGDEIMDITRGMF